MGDIKAYEPEKLVIGVMYTTEEDFQSAMAVLRAEYGEEDTVSEEYSFSDFSHFYDSEMDGSVNKRIISMKELVDPSRLSEIKLRTNDIEAEFSRNGNRYVNLDPCLMSHGKFVMATTKNASFRVPLERGIYADLSLVYARSHWVDFFWTYYDVKSDRVKKYLEKVRSIYLKQRKQG